MRCGIAQPCWGSSESALRMRRSRCPAAARAWLHGMRRSCCSLLASTRESSVALEEHGGRVRCRFQPPALGIGCWTCVHSSPGSPPPLPVAAPACSLVAQSTDVPSAMHWRSIGPIRAGRARAARRCAHSAQRLLRGLRQRWRLALDRLRSNWVPLFDDSPRARSRDRRGPVQSEHHLRGQRRRDHRPDLAIGDGIYKSTDAGKTWTHSGCATVR